MPRTRSASASGDKQGRPIEQYEHPDKQRPNNPPVGLVSGENDVVTAKGTYAYDPHLDPSLDWAGKAEHTSFEIPTVSLHVHERIDPRTIVEAVQRTGSDLVQASLFATPSENPPLRQALEFYKHPHGWTNRLIAGDSLLVMNSLLEKEGLAGQVQMVYIDPPYGIRYGSNFQPFVNKREVKDGKDEDLTQEPETIRAFRDTWELGIHSYLTYLRDRLLLARELLTDSGSCFVQISDENLHHVREVMDELFGADRFAGIIAFAKTSAFTSELLSSSYDYLIWYVKDRELATYRSLLKPRKERSEGGTYTWIELGDGTCRRLTAREVRGDDPLPAGKRFRADTIVSPGATATTKPVLFEGKEYLPSPNSHWKTTWDGMNRLVHQHRVVSVGRILAYKRFEDDFPYMSFANVWDDTIIGTFTDKWYVVQTPTLAIQRCILMATDPGDLVLDPTCGSGTTAYVAEQWGRRWLTCDTSRVSITLAKQRLMTAAYDYYELARPDEGVGSGFRYKTVPHVTLKSIAQNEPTVPETLYDQPYVDKTKARVTGPFTVEAVPSANVGRLQGFDTPASNGQQPFADASIAREGPTVQQQEWRDELLKTGIRGKSGQMIMFSRVEPLPGLRWVHADAETNPVDDGDVVASVSPERAVVSFGPQHAPIDQVHVESALQEAQKLIPKPKLVIFAAFQFDPEAAKDIDEMTWPGVTLLKVQMNADLLTADLKKKRSSNESFWLIGQPDIELRRANDGGKKYEVEVRGFDYYNTRTGAIDSGDSARIAMWLLDPDYDGRSLFPRQVFFPMAGENDGWARLAKNLKAEIDEDLIEEYRGTVSLPFEPGKHRQVAIKIVDDRGIESLKILPIEA